MKINFLRQIQPEETISYEKLINLLLKNRKIKKVNEFLNPKNPLDISLTDFGFKKEFKKICQILENLKKEKKMIVVYTDYDADGITGGAILWETLYLLGFKVMPYVPHRKNEGYGFSKIGLNNVKKIYNPDLIISVDHGITGEEKIKYAKSLGIKIIVTDHHLKPKKAPQSALAVFHIPELSGAGVAYFFAKEIFDYFSKDLSNNNFKGKKEQKNNQNSAIKKKLENYFATDYLALASIGTVADLVPLIGASRSIVKYGLASFQKVKRYGIKHILKEARIDNRPITPYEIGFMIAPRINAVGRLEHALDALRLLCTTDEKRASNLASIIGTKNRERQDLVEKSLDEAIKSLKSNINQLKLIILISDKWHEGIIGLIASKIAEKFYRPTIVITKVDGFYKGSARSIPNLDITKFLRELKKYLIDIGGHKQAAGFSLEEKNIKEFVKQAEKKADKELKEKDLEKKITVDFMIPIAGLTLELAKLIEKLEPFGIGNPRPTFYSRAEVVDAKVFGNKNEHLKIFVRNPIIYSSGNSGEPSGNSRSSFNSRQARTINGLELISFYAADQFPTLSRGQIIDVVYTLEIDRWEGKEKVRGKIMLIF
ncbi:MAG: single-stranded-DNA-specific exonuclease RecJ [Microgenomates group bacterium]|nr:single-stranded-DNA-specific exonuclease RecJ [Microgenomates group bacterium]